MSIKDLINIHKKCTAEPIEDQGKKKVEALEDLKPKEQTEAIEGKSNNQSNNQSKTKTIFNDLISKRKSIMNELYESVDDNNLKFEYYEYIDSKELFNKIKIIKIALMMHLKDRKSS